MKIISNVFISTSENYLQLADIYFMDRINHIETVSDAPIFWEQIATPEKRQEFQNQIPQRQPNTDAHIYDGRFLLLMPGAIDPHVHFNSPGFEHRDDFEHGSLAAASGGVTTVIDMPCTSIPPVTSVKRLKKKAHVLKDRSWVDYAFWGGLAGNEFESIEKYQHAITHLGKAGVIGFKVYCISGMASFQEFTYNGIAALAQYVRKAKLPLAVHAEDEYHIRSKQRKYETVGLNRWQDYCDARDDVAEAKAVYRMIAISRRTGCSIHIVHLSSKLALQLIQEAHTEGLPVTAETCPHYLYFTQDDFRNPEISAFLKTAPPVKLAEDRDALWQGLQDGTLLFVSTDHAGCDPVKEKTAYSFWDVYGGIPGVEHRVPFLFSEGFLKDRLSLARTIDLLSVNAADYFNLSERKGRLAPGNDADFTLIDLWNSQTICAENMHSKGKYTPFEGITLNAVVDATFVRGELVANQRGESDVNVGYGEPLGLEI